jgi:hypothetical protein
MKSKTIDVLKAERNEKERDDVGGVGAQKFFFIFFQFWVYAYMPKLRKKRNFFAFSKRPKTIWPGYSVTLTL